MSSRALSTAAAFLVLLSCISCMSSRQIAEMEEISRHLGLSLPSESLEDVEVVEEEVQIDSVSNEEGPLIMKAVRDSRTGEMTATDVISASRVVARFRNVAERDGRVTLAFDISVPAGLMSSDLQLEFTPEMEFMGERQALEPIILTGSRYRKRQLRGYERYRNFLASIIEDSTRLVHMELLEIFLRRHFPETWAMRNDSSIVPAPLVENLFGVTQKVALQHYTRQLLTRRNERRKRDRERMFHKFVKAPIREEGIRLDTVLSTVSGDMVYRYVQHLASRPGLRKVSVDLSGEVLKEGEVLARMPHPEKLTFYISSLSTLADQQPRYIFRIVDRVVQDHTNAFLDFASGSSSLDTLLPGNAAELGRIRHAFRDMEARTELQVDSVVVTASCSPEGDYRFNSRLSRKRSETVGRHIAGFLQDGADTVVKTRSVPENWEYFKVLVRNDSSLTPSFKEDMVRLASSHDLDSAERALSRMKEYRYLREKVYPRLRTVRFDFHLHRIGVEKDTVHTTELDSVYMRGLEAMKGLDYKTASALLKPYRDYNAALALVSAGYDHTARSILDSLPGQDARASYLSAVIDSRLGNLEQACLEFLESVEMEPAMRHRANLDPELAEVLSLCKKKGLLP